MHSSKLMIAQTSLLNSAGLKTKQKDTKELMGRRVFAKVGRLERVEVRATSTIDRRARN